MAADYIAAIRMVQSLGPYLLGGWSIGGLIAFEMARQLEAQGEEVRLLAMFDTHAPNAEESETSDDASLLASFALNLGVSPEQLQAAVDSFSQAQTEDPLSFLLDYAKATSVIPHDMSLARLRQQFHVFNVNVQAARSYQPGGLAASIALFRAVEGSPGDPTLGWSRLGLENLEVHDAPGSHLTMLREPSVSVLAERLAECFATKRRRRHRRHKRPK
jgi:thioesterase domain-containing protein